MKKILIVAYTYTNGGGAERVLSDICNNLNYNKYEVTILPYAEYSVATEPVKNNVKLLPSIVDMNTAGRLEKAAKYFLVHFFPSLLRKKYIKERYDIEISFNYQIPSFLVMGNNGAKVIQWNHGDIYDLQHNLLKRKLQERSFKRADIIVAISENTNNSIRDVFPKYAHKIQMIYNGVNVERILKMAQEDTDIVLKEHSIVFLGRLEEAKKPLKLLEVMRGLISKGKPINLYYLGEGEQADEIQQKIELWGMQQQVFLLGYIKNPYPIIKQSRAVCMLSAAEGFPTVFTEGMVLGRPFISSEVGGVKELSNEGKCGRIVYDMKECEEAIVNIVLNEEVNAEMGKACMKHIENYSLKRQIDTIESLLETI